MEGKIEEYVRLLSLGDTKRYENMTVTPVFGPKRDLGYLVFDEAIAQGLKVSETGTVGSLTVHNGTGKEVLMMQGEYVVGGYQNRMIAQNIYMEKGFTGKVPVNCVQHGRWTTHIPKNFETSRNMVPRMVAKAAFRGQNEVWNCVNFMADSLHVRSSTSDMDEVRINRYRDLKEVADNFKYQQGSVGVIITVGDDKSDYSVDLFDNPKTMEKNFSKLVNASALDAIAAGGNSYSLSVDELLQGILEARSIERKAISLGQDLKIEGKELQGSALIYQGMPIYLNYGSSGGNGNSPGSSGPGTGYRRPRPRPRPNPFPPWPHDNPFPWPNDLPWIEPGWRPEDGPHRPHSPKNTRWLLGDEIKLH